MSTVRVRIAVAVWPDGSWIEGGGYNWPDIETMRYLLERCAAEPGYTIRWITAEVPVPTEAPELPPIHGVVEP